MQVKVQPLVVILKRKKQCMFILNKKNKKKVIFRFPNYPSVEKKWNRMIVGIDLVVFGHPK